MQTESKPRKTRVERLVVLPFRQSLSISFKSLKVRFFRSLITTMSLVLAVSFLSFVNVSVDVGNGLLNTQEPEYRRILIQSGYDIGPEETQIGKNPKQQWIIILSLLVCVVGIVNAQLMAVTERFREIGTMKCLGALDRFVLRLFLLEAGMQGIAGAIIGSLLGAIFSLLNALLQYGTAAVRFIGWNDFFLSVAAGVVVGFVLSLVGVLYPAFVASRMQPVEAMRVEQ